MLRWSAYLAWGCLAIVGAGCGISNSVQVIVDSDPDQEAATLLADKANVAEANAWLAGDPKLHTLWSGDRATAAALVDALYAAGATEISAVGISREGDVEMTDLMLVTLPTDAAARQKVFTVHNDFWRKYLVDADNEDLLDFIETDHGQKYLYLNFDA